MKRSLFALAFFATVASPFAYADQQSTINVGKVNKIVSDVIKKIIKGDDLIKKLELKLDPKATDLPNNKFKLLASATAKNTPWAPGTESTLSMNLGFQATVAGQNANALVRLGGGLKTDTPALIRVLAKKALKKLGTPADENERKGKDLLEQLTELKSTEELVSILSQLTELVTKEYNEKVKEVQAELAEASRAGNEERVAYLKRELERMQKDIETFLAVKITPRRAADGKFLGIAIQSDKPFRLGKGDLFDAELAPVRAAISDTQITIAFDLKFKTKARYVDEGRRAVESYLLKLQNGKPNGEERKAVERLAKGWLEMAKEALKGDILN
jgi:hypothetical protein